MGILKINLMKISQERQTLKQHWLPVSGKDNNCFIYVMRNGKREYVVNNGTIRREERQGKTKRNYAEQLGIIGMERYLYLKSLTVKG